jgi:hypothetical protein
MPVSVVPGFVWDESRLLMGGRVLNMIDECDLFQFLFSGYLKGMYVSTCSVFVFIGVFRVGDPSTQLVVYIRAKFLELLAGETGEFIAGIGTIGGRW